MNNLGKALMAAIPIFVGGYLVGFYECKYKTMKVLCTVMSEKREETQK